jgi:hypothetical protein
LNLIQKPIEKCLRTSNLINSKIKILPINAGLASKTGMICVENVDIKRTIEVYHRPGESECYTLVPAVTLADIVNKYCITSESILKRIVRVANSMLYLMIMNI